jgi:FdhD protein
MKEAIDILPILQLDERGMSNVRDAVVKEFPLTIVLNNRELVTLLCSPVNLKYLTIGFLFSEGLLNDKDEIKRITVDDRIGVGRVETKNEMDIPDELLFKRLISSGCGRGASFYSATDTINQRVESQTTIMSDEVFSLVREFQGSSDVYLATHGVHSAALCDTKSILVLSEDIGRHNAIDKIFGECILEDISTNDRIIVTSGRVSSEVIHKVAKRGVPIIISLSVPTDLGVRIADDLRITLIGFVRGKRMKIYAHAWRVASFGGEYSPPS